MVYKLYGLTEDDIAIVEENILNWIVSNNITKHNNTSKKNIFEEKELEEVTCKDFLQVQNESINFIITDY